MTVRDGGIDRYTKIAEEIATAQGIHGAPGITFLPTGDICVHSQLHSLSLPFGSPPTSIFNYTFLPNELDGTKDFIKLDFLVVSDAIGLPADTLAFKWNGFNINFVAGGVKVLPTQIMYSALIAQNPTSSDMKWASIDGSSSTQAVITDVVVPNWMSLGGALSGTFTMANDGLGRVVKLFLWIYKVIGP